jgi:protein-S-isoprenylcysteine O-methyltransferase Ste14
MVMVDDDSATHESRPDAGQPPGEPAEDSVVAELQAELEASLSAGFVPNGWTHRITWEPREEKRIVVAIVVAIVVVLIGVAAGWLIWGWKAGLAVGMVTIGLGMLLTMRRGPRPGDTITESFIPPDETLLELGIAGHELVRFSQSRPEFSQTRQATRADRRNLRLTGAAIGALFAFGGSLTLLVESGRISPGASLRVGSVVGAAVSAGIAVWYWRLIGRYMNSVALATNTGGSPLPGSCWILPPPESHLWRPSGRVC